MSNHQPPKLVADIVEELGAASSNIELPCELVNDPAEEDVELPSEKRPERDVGPRGVSSCQI